LITVELAVLPFYLGAKLTCAAESIMAKNSNAGVGPLCGSLESIEHISREARRKLALKLAGVLALPGDLMIFSFVAKTLAEGALTPCGVWLCPGTGGLRVYDEETGFAPVA